MNHVFRKAMLHDVIFPLKNCLFIAKDGVRTGDRFKDLLVDGIDSPGFDLSRDVIG